MNEREREIAELRRAYALAVAQGEFSEASALAAQVLDAEREKARRRREKSGRIAVNVAKLPELLR